MSITPANRNLDAGMHYRTYMGEQNEFTFQPGSVVRRELATKGREKYYHYGVASEFYHPETEEQMIYQLGGPYDGEAPDLKHRMLTKMWPTATPGGWTGTHVGLTRLERFAELKDVELVIVPNNPIPVLERAKSLLNHRGWSMTTYNCEHYANYCLTGDWKSKQVSLATNSVSKKAGLAALAGFVAWLAS